MIVQFFNQSTFMAADILYAILCQGLSQAVALCRRPRACCCARMWQHGG